MTNKAVEKISEFEKFGSILGLERMNDLLELLGNPQDNIKVIHVAGTNGKGSTCRYMYSVLQEAGYKTGLFTSPFLEKFNERIEFNGELITDEDLAVYTERVLEKVKVLTEAGRQSPTEFEVVTAIAFLYFAEKNCDFVILEVGLGGSGDSTNVCKKPLVTAITSVSFDHMDRLGNTIEEIARDKAGIIKQGVPVITSAKNEAALGVIKAVAESKKAKYIETRGFEVDVTAESLAGYRFDVEIDLNESNSSEEQVNSMDKREKVYGKLASAVDGGMIILKGLEICMAGRHQIDNAVAAVTTLKQLEADGHAKISEAALIAGLKKARQFGRFEVMTDLQEKPVVIIDGAHNIDGAVALKNAVKSIFVKRTIGDEACTDGKANDVNFCSYKKILMITGMLADKDVDGIIGEFTEITKDFIVTEPDNPRKLAAADLAAKLEAKGANCKIAPKAEEACKLSESIKEDYDVVLYAGSLYLIGKVRSVLKNA